MKAVLCKEYGPAEKLVIEDIPAPSIGADGVLIEVKAAGINFPDTLIIETNTSLSRRCHLFPVPKWPAS